MATLSGLGPETVGLMAQSHLEIETVRLTSAAPALSKNVDLFPSIRKDWGLGFLITGDVLPTGRSAGSLAWAGLADTYFWIDRVKGVCGVFLSQVLPCFDDRAVDLAVQFETEVYRAL